MRTALVTLAVGGVLAAGLVVPANAAHEGTAVTGLTQNGRLVSFTADDGTITGTTRITGVTLGEKVVAIDYRPATGELFGVAASDGTGYLYEIDDTTGAATLLGTGFPISGDVSIDFNPTVDRLRVVSTDGTNLRVNPNNGALGATDGRLAYAGLDQAPSVVGVAYTNNDDDAATGTQLFDADAALDQLALQAPPNDGVLNSVGALGVDVARDTGFDVYSEVVGGRAVSNLALLSVNQGSTTTTYVVNTTTGAVNRASASVVDSRPAVVDIAIPTEQ